ncbi:aminotransferase-like domain-containing protein [Microbacterium sp. No. 7]|uniref:aminotransferase-like domain-containing protein n=1 Tax=Microbacterium sp. No. 7 TaxID=1714373 RepID=UPI0006CFB802|nr:PLP-dependent aminotransferase family protein [Microbacterium sp. No. 7]ALJ21924.1 MocR family transcriptional regulator [Microbacterium sp. No. 7]
MSRDDRATSRLVDHRTATVAAERLGERLGAWARGDGALAGRLAEAIARLVATGELRAGDRLPSERALATVVAVSRGTVVAAYSLLAERELVERRQGSGTRVAGVPAPVVDGRRRAQGERLFTAAPSAIDLLRAVPRIPDGAVRIVRGHVPQVDPVALAETDPAGLSMLRERIAALMTAEGTPTTREQVLVTHGGQQALSLLVDELVSPGDVVLTEAVTWPGIADPVRRRGARVQGIGMNGDGIDVDELEAAMATLRPALVALNPHNHNPTGGSASAPVRLRVAELAAQYGIPVVEDRVLAHASFDGPAPPSLAGLRPDAPILVVESVSKWSWSGLRVGWLRADPVLVRRLRTLRQSVDQTTSIPAQLLALDLIERAPALRREVVDTHRAACRTATAAIGEHLPGWSFVPPRGGFSVWARMPAGSADAFIRTAARHGVAVAGGREFMASEAADDHVRVPYTAPEETLREGIARLGAAWRDYAAHLVR